MEKTINTNEIKIYRVLQVLAMVCWWGSIVLFIIHMTSCFADPIEPAFYENTLIPSKAAYVTITFLQWFIMSILYGLSGYAVMKTNVKMLRFISIIAFFIQVMVCIYYYNYSSGRIIEGAFWGFILLLSWIWLANIKKEDGRIVRFYLLIPLIMGFAATCMWNPVSTDNDASLWNHIEILSFYIQWILRSGVVLFTGLWLAFLTYEINDETIVITTHRNEKKSVNR